MLISNTYLLWLRYDAADVLLIKDLNRILVLFGVHHAIFLALLAVLNGNFARKMCPPLCSSSTLAGASAMMSLRSPVGCNIA